MSALRKLPPSGFRGLLWVSRIVVGPCCLCSSRKLVSRHEAPARGIEKLCNALPRDAPDERIDEPG